MKLNYVLYTIRTYVEYLKKIKFLCWLLFHWRSLDYVISSDELLFHLNKDDTHKEFLLLALNFAQYSIKTD